MLSITVSGYFNEGIQNIVFLQPNIEASIETESKTNFYEIEKFETNSSCYEYENVAPTENVVLLPNDTQSKHSESVDNNIISNINSNLLVTKKYSKYFTNNICSRGVGDTSKETKKSGSVKHKRKKELPRETTKRLGKKFKIYTAVMPTLNIQKKNLITPHQIAAMNDEELIDYEEHLHKFQDGPTSTSASAATTSYRCEKCEMHFDNLHKYEAHIKEVHELQTNPYACPHCPMTYKCFKQLLQHMNEIHSNETTSYKCGYCHKTFKLSRAFLNHMKLHPPTTEEDCKNTTEIHCDQCTFVAANKNSLNAHKKFKHKISTCDECSKEFKCQYSLKKHFKKLHGTIQTDFKCTECNLTFSSKTILNNHRSSSHNKLNKAVSGISKVCNLV